MSKLILDCDLMKTPNSGLYHYCLSLGQHVNQVLEERGEEHMKFYVPTAEAQTFSKRDTIVEQPNHKFLKPFLWDCKVWHAPFQAGRIIPKTKKIKVVLTVHDLNILHQNLPIEEQQKGIKHLQELINRADAIICISEFCKNDVLKNCDIKGKLLYVIYNGVNDLQHPALLSTSYQPKFPFLFAIGFINQKKNLHVLLPLLTQNKDMELLIAGRLDEPAYIADMQRQAEEMGIKDRFHILGPVSEGEQAWYLKHCMAYVHPSLAEGFGLPVVEAMSLGKPLFLSNLTSLPEIGGEAAFYFQNFEPEHMQQVYVNGMRKYSENGLVEKIIERSTYFNWQQNAAKYVEVYYSLL
jgi:glycosyltransferase involved in cell wall biosynthesis